MSYSFTQGSTNSDQTPVGRRGVVEVGSADSVITFPNATGTMSLGPTIVASGIITMSALSQGYGSGSVTVTGLETTDVVMTTIDTDASASSFFYTRVNAAADTISFRGLTVSGSTYAKCHYVVYRSI